MAASPDARQRAKLAWLAPLLRLFAALSRATHGSVTGIDALLGGPVLLFDPEVATDENAWASLPPAARGAALAALFHAVAWVREALNAFAPEVAAYCAEAGAAGGNGAAGGGATQGGGDTAATQAGQESRLLALADHQVKVLARLAQLRQLEALLARLAGAAGARLTAQLPDLARPLAGATLHGLSAAAGGGAGGAAAASAAPAPEPAPDAEAARKLRALEAPALLALHAEPPPRGRLTVLAPAAHLAGDALAKLRLLAARARRPAFAAAGGAGAPAPLLPPSEWGTDGG